MCTCHECSTHPISQWSHDWLPSTPLCASADEVSGLQEAWSFSQGMQMTMAVLWLHAHASNPNPPTRIGYTSSYAPQLSPSIPLYPRWSKSMYKQCSLLIPPQCDPSRAHPRPSHPRYRRYYNVDKSVDLWESPTK